MRRLGQYDKGIEEINRYLLQESYHSPDRKGTLGDDSYEGMRQEEEHFICYYMRGKLLIGKGDFKNAIINFNNAQLIDEQSLKVYARRIQA